MQYIIFIMYHCETSAITSLFTGNIHPVDASGNVEGICQQEVRSGRLVEIKIIVIFVKHHNHTLSLPGTSATLVEAEGQIDLIGNAKKALEIYQGN